ncbi:head decoration protein [Actinoplanes sp. URMC 104]|uniref:head decoration protein n=1 Tax=Actinoplanes sp. URMC 104 TaxID=3423409 RepID=UPI003F1CE8D2
MSGLDISVRTGDAFIPEDRSWLGDVDGTQATRSITLNPALFTPATHFPNGVLKSGTLIARVTAAGATQGNWGPYTAGASNGLQTPVGVLFNTVRMSAGGPKVGAPLQERGVIRPNRLPANSGLDAAARTAMAAKWIFRD